MTTKHTPGPLSDRELIELAAKAAGYKWKEIPERNNAGINALWLLNPDGTLAHTGWDPLHDDGVALRLAAKLHIDLDFNNYGVTALIVDLDRCETKDFIESADEEFEGLAAKFAATRRAIVRAAAEIAKAKGETQ